MNRNEIQVLSAVVVVLFILSLGFTHEFRITRNEDDQWGPAIYGDIVVWTDTRNGNNDIYGFNLQTRKEFQISSDPHGQCCPEIYRDTVIWVDERNGNRDIYGFNIQTNEEFQITVDPYEQWYPAIYEDTIVYVDYRDDTYRICMYNLSTSEEVPIVTYKAPYWFSELRPHIYRDTVIWMDEVTTPENTSFRNIHGYNLSTSQEFQIPADEHLPRFSPAIYDDNILWTEFRYGNYDIFGYNLQNHEEFHITTGQDDQGGSVIYGDVVIWFSDSNSDTLYGYNISTQEKFQIKTTAGLKGTLAFYGDIIVWDNKRTDYEGRHNYDIYGYNLSKTYIGFRFTRIDALIFLIVITGAAIFLKRTQIKETLNRKTAARLLLSMGASLILVVIGYLGMGAGSSLQVAAQIINFLMIMFYRTFFYNPFYEKVGYFITFLFWTGVFYAIIKLWKD